MANWRTKLRPASFKGIKFEVEAHDNESGRRGHLHEYPNKSVPYLEDMGKKAETFVFEAFVIGDDYIERRDALKEACNSVGSGTLIHPTFGTVEVGCVGCRIAERSSEGRMARFSLSFTEAGEQALPTAAINYKDQVLELADATEANATESFLSRFSIIGKASSIADSVAGVAGTFADNASGALEIANSKIASVTSVTDTGISAIDTITGVANDMSDLSSNALNILKTPSVFAARVSESLMVINGFLSPRDAIKQTKATTNLGVSEQTARINPDTPKGADQIEMMQQIEVLTQRVGLANQAKTISSIEFTSSAEAEEVLDDFMQQVEDQVLLEVPSDDSVLQSLKDMRAALVKDISNTIKKLPEVATIKVAENTPSVVLAYSLYEDIDRASEISDRNNVRKPGFIPAGKDIEVLTK